MCLVLINSFNLDKYWAYSTFLYLKEILPDTFYMFKFHTVQRPISLHLIFHLKPCPISWVQLTPWNQKRRHTGRELHHLVAWQRRTTLKQKWNHNIPLTDRSQRSALQTSSTFDEQGLDWLNLSQFLICTFSRWSKLKMVSSNRFGHYCCRKQFDYIINNWKWKIA